MSILSKISELSGKINEADLGSPISGSSSLAIEVGGAPTEFNVVSPDGTTETGYVRVDAARLIDARYRVQAKVSDPNAENHVLDMRIITRCEIGLKADGQFIPLPFHADMWQNHLLSFYGQHQGANEASVNQLGQLLSNRGWIVTEREAFESNSKRTPFDLSTRGGRSMAERSKLDNGAIPVASFTLRASAFTGEDGTTRGFTDLVTDSVANLERWYHWKSIVKGDTAQEQIVDRYMLAPTGAVTQQEGEGATKRLATFPNRADIPVLTLNMGTVEEPTFVEINLWPDDAPSRQGESTDGVVSADNAM